LVVSYGVHSSASPKTIPSKLRELHLKLGEFEKVLGENSKTLGVFLKEVGHFRKETWRFHFSACFRANRPWLLLQQKQRDYPPLLPPCRDRNAVLTARWWRM